MNRFNHLVEKQKGFAFVEVLVAFALLSIVMGFVFQNTARSTRLLQISERVVAASVYAQSQLDRVLAQNKFENGEHLLSGDERYRTVLSVSAVTSLMQAGRYADGRFWKLRLNIYERNAASNAPPLFTVEQLVHFYDRAPQ